MKANEFGRMNGYGKLSKQCVTVLVGASMTGEQLVIGKSKKLCSFPLVHTLSAMYKNNVKAWMITDIFQEWLMKLDEDVGIQNHHIALLLDNCLAHPCVENLKNITLFSS